MTKNKRDTFFYIVVGLITAFVASFLQQGWQRFVIVVLIIGLAGYAYEKWKGTSNGNKQK
ncbi:hypothetical protein [Streptococcus sp. S784/96/1]|uniref:hypothetical protein n=1 Tax=Streptococcus sp. S784/96/1 TaxID=2653499 RepID=UPI0013870C31|nr:hypothetical protein [Streptococcus sp. S784/96/1]